MHDELGEGIVRVTVYTNLAFLEPYPPPDHIYLSSIGPRFLAFEWNSVVSSCQALSYNIVTSNCGICNANYTSATCVNVPTDGSICILGVQTVVCNNISGQSNSVAVMLKGELFTLIECTNAIASENCIQFQVFLLSKQCLVIQTEAETTPTLKFYSMKQ